MNHLTVDEIIDFVSADKINPEFLSLAEKVNSHICECDECLEKVRAYQLVRDELTELCTFCGFEKLSYKIVDKVNEDSDTEDEETTDPDTEGELEKPSDLKDGE